MISIRGGLGFTLIELLIVVAVIGILTAIAVPMYRDYVVRSNRTEAIIALTELANLQEKHFSNELAYTQSFTALNNYPRRVPPPPPVDNPDYELDIQTGSTVAYTITAESIGTQDRDDPTCQEFTLNSFGQRGAVDEGGNDTSQECWNR